MENPKIRFKGFTKDWEQRKLGELGSLKNGMNFSKEAMGHGFPFINLQNIFGNNVIDVNKLELADATEKQLLEYSLLKGDVLFVRSSVKLEGVGEAALVPETLENTTYSGFIIRFRDEYGLNNDFKKYIFGTTPSFSFSIVTLYFFRTIFFVKTLPLLSEVHPVFLTKKDRYMKTL